MRKNIYKLFWAWDFDKEERWLNEMAAKGLALVAVGLTKYTFEEGQPGEYNIRLELLNSLPSHYESQHYINFIEETGAEYLGSIIRWVYFRKKTAKGEFNLFSDNKSRIKHLNRLLFLLGILGPTHIIIGLSNISIYLKMGTSINLAAGILSLFLTILLGYGYLHISRKKSKLKKELQLFE